jgi:hypothetical protein
MPAELSILTTTVGSYPVPDWLNALPSEQARLDATRVVFALQRQAGLICRLMASSIASISIIRIRME